MHETVNISCRGKSMLHSNHRLHQPSKISDVELTAMNKNKRGGQKSLGKNGIIQNSMLRLELGIQIKQGWQFLYYCQITIEIKNCFLISTFPFFHMFCTYTHIVKCFQRNFWLSLLSNSILTCKPIV